MILRQEIEYILLIAQTKHSLTSEVADTIVDKIVDILKQELVKTRVISPFNMHYDSGEIPRLNGTKYDGIQRAITIIKKRGKKK